MQKSAAFLFVLGCASVLSGCSWTTDRLGPDSYEISGYFDFTLNGSVVLKTLESQAEEYCRSINKNFVPDIYFKANVNRKFNYSAQRAAAKIRFRCIPPAAEITPNHGSDRL
jgi:hypothetical protein